MNAPLSSDEKAVLQRVRQREGAWRRLRWAYLAINLATLIVGLLLGQKILHLLASSTVTEQRATSISLATVAHASSGLTISYLLALWGFAGIFSTLARWRGDPANQLLLLLAKRLEGDTHS